MLPQRRRRRRRREKSSLPPLLLLVPANSHLRNEEGNCGEQEEGEEETRKGKSPRVLPLFRSVLESGGDLPRALHTSVIPSNRVSSSSVVVANFCTPSAHRPTAGRTRYIVPAEAKTQRAPALRSTEGGRRRVEDGKPRGREGEGQKSEVISLPR